MKNFYIKATLVALLNSISNIGILVSVYVLFSKLGDNPIELPFNIYLTESMEIYVWIFTIISLYFLQFLRVKYTSYFAYKAKIEMTMSAIMSFLNGPAIITESVPKHEFVNLINNELGNLAETYFLPIFELVSGAISLLFLIVFVIYVDPVAGILAVTTLAAVYLVTFGWARKKVSSLGDQRLLDFESRQLFTENLHDGFHSIITQNLGSRLRQSLSNVLSSLFYAERRIYNISNIPKIMTEMTLYLLLGIVLLSLISKNSDFDLVTRLLFLGVSAQKIMPELQKVYMNGSKVVYAKVQFNKIRDFIENAKNSQRSSSPIAVKNLIKANEINIVRGEKKIIRQLDCSFQVGKKYGFIGPSGVGKSTFLKAFCGFIPLTGGELRFDDCAVSVYSNNDWFEQISYVPQTVFLENGIVGNYAEQLASLPHSAQKALRIDDLSYKTEIRNLSGGERQRLAIALVLTQDKEYLFFDEATASLDKKTGEAVERYVTSMFGKTVFWVSHKIYDIRNFDEIVNFELGNSVEKQFE